ncbi:hypothetical protein [Spiroplasma ixodetis]|uniref:hypothetical protein n=1 Tax=Spiroplasma ixodetis TaxID=2141 RepID=UPI002574AFFA|nr:hypothetical protein [Spiroplasma ixodetis]WJG70244.1 hypothetical protein SIXOD_v1c13340 [Spiroplasma ixodetis Y32]
MTIDEFINKYKNDFKFEIGHFQIMGDYTLTIKKTLIYMFNLEFFQEFINDFKNNKDKWEQKDICKGCK